MKKSGVYQAAKKRPSAALRLPTGSLILLPCQAGGRLIAVFTCRERFKTVPYEGFCLPA
jgi:hypothetical protein